MKPDVLDTILDIVNSKPKGPFQVSEALEELLVQCLRETAGVHMEKISDNQTNRDVKASTIMRAYWEHPVLSKWLNGRCLIPATPPGKLRRKEVKHEKAVFYLCRTGRYFAYHNGDSIIIPGRPPGAEGALLANRFAQQ